MCMCIHLALLCFNTYYFTDHFNLSEVYLVEYSFFPDISHPMTFSIFCSFPSIIHLFVIGIRRWEIFFWYVCLIFPRLFLDTVQLNIFNMQNCPFSFLKIQFKALSCVGIFLVNRHTEVIRFQGSSRSKTSELKA